MSEESIFDQIKDLKTKFRESFVNKKKIKALDNYADATIGIIQQIEKQGAPVPFRFADNLLLIKRIIQKGFLRPIDVEYLGSLIEDLNINYLDWCHKTKWLDREMERVASYAPKVTHQQLNLFPEINMRSTARVPTELLARSGRKRTRAAV